MSTTPTSFFHFTDGTHALAIGGERLLMPGGPLEVVWMTSIGNPQPSGAQLNLTPESVRYRFEVKDVANVKPWTMVREQYDPEVWWPMELAAGARPELWFISTEPVAIHHVKEMTR